MKKHLLVVVIALIAVVAHAEPLITDPPITPMGSSGPIMPPPAPIKG